jgi:hypothetical protein
MRKSSHSPHCRFSIFLTIWSLHGWLQQPPSGVYLQCPPMADCHWSKLDALPGEATCIACQNGGTLWAGTDSGLYRCRLSTDVLFGNAPSSAGNIIIVNKERYASTLIFPQLITGTLDLIDLRGRTRIHRQLHSSRNVTGDQPAGIYLYRITEKSGYSRSSAPRPPPRLLRISEHCILFHTSIHTSTGMFHTCLQLSMNATMVT